MRRWDKNDDNSICDDEKRFMANVFAAEDTQKEKKEKEAAQRPTGHSFSEVSVIIQDQQKKESPEEKVIKGDIANPIKCSKLGCVNIPELNSNMCVFCNNP